MQQSKVFGLHQNSCPSETLTLKLGWNNGTTEHETGRETMCNDQKRAKIVVHTYLYEKKKYASGVHWATEWICWVSIEALKPERPNSSTCNRENRCAFRVFGGRCHILFIWGFFKKHFHKWSLKHLHNVMVLQLKSWLAPYFQAKKHSRTSVFELQEESRI